MKSRVPTILIGLVVPIVGIVALFPWWNRIEPFVLGLSFNYFWMFLWIFLTAACLLVAYKLDPLNVKDLTDNGKEG